MGKKLVIVEKDSDILYILKHIFEDHGYSVLPFSSEFGVLDRIVKEKPDVVVLDVMSPTVAGTILCREIKSHKEIKDIPVVALSTHVESHKIHSICADKVLGKPFEITELIDAVESQLTA